MNRGHSENHSDPEGLLEGVVTRAHSGQCVVSCGADVYFCRVRGRLKFGPKQVQTVAVVGDRVRLRPLDQQDSGPPAGVIEEVLPRRTKVSRVAARRSGGRIEQVLMANLDQVVAVQSVTEPAPRAGFVDRLLVAAERFQVVGTLCLNKCDLDPVGADDPAWSYYPTLGYRVIRTSAVTGKGLDQLQDALTDRISVLLGASGVGKSSLLNRLQPDLDLRVAPIGEKSGLGKHTTTRTELFQLDFGGFIADSPGLRGFDPWQIEPVDLADHFPDLSAARDRCRFRTCFHRDEPDCGVKHDVAAGRIPAARYRAYLALLEDLEGRQSRPWERLPRK